MALPIPFGNEHGLAGDVLPLVLSVLVVVDAVSVVPHDPPVQSPWPFVRRTQHLGPEHVFRIAPEEGEHTPYQDKHDKPANAQW